MSESTRPPAPWIARQAQALLRQQGHAWLLQGPSGLGQYELALSLAQAWLCESPVEEGACGHCPSCHAIAVRTHADLCVLMPETSLMALDWPLSEKAQAEIDDKKRKPSREIRIDAMRDAIEFAQRTSARGRGKVVLVFPAEQMNAVTANALLKTLEEPVGDVRFVLASESAHQLLPTIRSRCLGHTMAWPDAQQALQWLGLAGLPASEAQALLQAAGGRPQQAADFFDSGLTARDWAAFPQAIARADFQTLKDWSPSGLVDALHKLCHDALALQAGAAGRFFPQEAVQAVVRSTMPVLLDWSRSLRDARRTMDHPFNPGLMQEALVEQARSALNSTR